MNLKRNKAICGIFVSVLVVLFFGTAAFAAGEGVPCVDKDVMFEVIEKIPKNLSPGEKDNVYTLERNTYGVLTVVVDNMNVRFFDSTDPDPKKWGSVSNGIFKDEIKADVSRIGCVISGVNNYETGVVDKSPGAKDIAQKRFNEYIQLVQKMLKK